MTLLYMLLGAVAVVVLAYLVSRAASLGWFRTRAEYEKSIRRIQPGDDHNAKR